ncbi:hypothetical protein E4T80_02695 [Muribacter muris]|uniref:Uncharacterized protein n=1 Tax=Muribacter muris TaxID=67855 RepID=A0A4Y9K4V0_9PAST|nr:hypothetical protein [Muribacter muris]MBF0784384.1 hypothetical protein [Muribacter muris]MBF0827930.1 hypothetical protein [Muribacter muris]TFV12159.1 hypothetical protein E4T80_02695 [Muribacter muris]
MTDALCASCFNPMKYHYFFLFAFFCALLTACGSPQFRQVDLNPEFYQGYWAMNPIGELYRVLKFHPNGSVKVYDYQCEGSASYRLNETETYHLRKIKPNIFNLLDNQHNAFATFEIVRVNPQQLHAKQQFLDKSVEPNSYQLRYRHQVGAKPMCNQ